MTEYKDIKEDMHDNSSLKYGLNTIPSILIVIAHELRELNKNLRRLADRTGSDLI